MVEGSPVQIEWSERRDRKGHPLDIRPARPLLTRIAQEWSAHQIWLFGSRARGEAGPWSDWDLLVVVPDALADLAARPLAAWDLQKGTGVPADIVTCAASEFVDATETPNTIAFEAARNGVLLYER